MTTGQAPVEERVERHLDVAGIPFEEVVATRAMTAMFVPLEGKDG
jgi:hypothetical protein